MEFNQLWKNRKKQTYKVMIFRYIFLFTTIFFIAFGGYAFYNYEAERLENAQKEASNTLTRIVSSNDERFSNLRQYYVTMAENDSIRWILENDITYSNYSNYKAAYDDMSSKGIFGDYIAGFTFANFKTGWILSNKGLYPIYEVYNRDTLLEMYERKTDMTEKTFWSYDEGVMMKSVDRKYRVTVETDGLNFVMHLPASSYNSHAIFIANIDMDTWKSWIAEWTEEYEEVVVLDENGEKIYATNEAMLEQCMKYSEDMPEKLMCQEKQYAVAKKQSSILGWNYYIFYDVAGGQVNLKFPVMVFLVLIILLAVCFVVVSHLIYMPIETLMKKVSDSDGLSKKMIGNELDYLAGRYQNLKKDKLALEGLLYQQQDKLQELFELRLIHGEVKEEEWDEYLQGFQLRPWKYFATTVVILNLRDEEVQSMVNEDAICLQILQELPEHVKAKAWMPPIYNASAIFAIFSEDDESALLEQIREFYAGIQECAKQTCDYQIMMGVSATHTNYHHIRAAYRESIHALTKDYEMSISANDEKENDYSSSETQDCRFYLANTTVLGNDYDAHFEEEIAAAVKAVDKQQCYYVTDAFSRYLSQVQSNNEAILVYILRYVNTILLTAVQADINLSELYPDGMKKIYRELLEVVEPDRIRRYIKWKFIDPVIKKRTEFLENHSYSMLEEIEHLIAERNGNISLTECADLLGVHQTYIWKILKMERGKSFSDYVEEYKLIEAKRLLLESNLTVAEIAEKLNYTNAQNFIRFFSKSTGVTPGKFRKLY